MAAAGPNSAEQAACSAADDVDAGLQHSARLTQQIDGLVASRNRGETGAVLAAEARDSLVQTAQSLPPQVLRAHLRQPGSMGTIARPLGLQMTPLHFATAAAPAFHSDCASGLVASRVQSTSNPFDAQQMRQWAAAQSGKHEFPPPCQLQAQSLVSAGPRAGIEHQSPAFGLPGSPDSGIALPACATWQTHSPDTVPTRPPSHDAQERMQPRSMGSAGIQQQGQPTASSGQQSAEKKPPGTLQAAAGMQQAKRQRVNEPEQLVPERAAPADAAVPLPSLHPHGKPDRTAVISVLPAENAPEVRSQQVQVWQPEQGVRPARDRHRSCLPSSMMDAEPHTSAMHAFSRPATPVSQIAVPLSPDSAELLPVTAPNRLTGQLDISEPMQAAQNMQAPDSTASAAADLSAAARSGAAFVADDRPHLSAPPHLEQPSAHAEQARLAAAAGPHMTPAAVSGAMQPKAGTRADAGPNLPLPQVPAAGISMQTQHAVQQEAAQLSDVDEPAMRAQRAASGLSDAGQSQDATAAGLPSAAAAAWPQARPSHGSDGAHSSVRSAGYAQPSAALQEASGNSATQAGMADATALQRSAIMHADTENGAGAILGSEDMPNPFASAAAGDSLALTAPQGQSAPPEPPVDAVAGADAHRAQSWQPDSPFKAAAQAQPASPSPPAGSSPARQAISTASPAMSSPHISACASHFSPGSSTELGSCMPVSRRCRMGSAAAAQIAAALRPQPLVSMQLPALGNQMHVLSQIDDSTTALARVLGGKGLPSLRQSGRDLHTALTASAAGSSLAEVLRSSNSAPWQSAYSYGSGHAAVARAAQAHELGKAVSSPQQLMEKLSRASSPSLLKGAASPPDPASKPGLLLGRVLHSSDGALQQDWPVKPAIKIPDSGFAATSSGGWRGRKSVSPLSDHTRDASPKADASPDGSPGRGSSCSPTRTPTGSPQKARPGQQGSPRLSMAPPRSAQHAHGARLGSSKALGGRAAQRALMQSLPHRLRGTPAGTAADRMPFNHSDTSIPSLRSWAAEHLRSMNSVQSKGSVQTLPSLASWGANGATERTAMAGHLTSLPSTPNFPRLSSLVTPPLMVASQDQHSADERAPLSDLQDADAHMPVSSPAPDTSCEQTEEAAM